MSRNIETARPKDTEGYSEIVRSTSPSYSFRLTRDSPDHPYVIRDVAEGGDKRAPEFGRYYFDGFVCAPYVAFGRPVREIMDLPELKFRLVDVSEVTSEGRRLVRISFEFRPVPDYPMLPAWIEVDPEFGWAVRRYEGLFGTNRNRPRTGVVEYSGMERGRPVVRRVDYQNSTSKDVFEIAEIDFDRRPDRRDFTLSAFGLPEVNQTPGQDGSIPLNYWLFGLGAVALGLSIVIRRAVRGRPASPEGKAVQERGRR